MCHNSNNRLKSLNSQQAWLQAYIDSPAKQKQLYRRTLLIVVISQVFGGAGLAAGITVGALLAKDMLGTDSYAGLPVALFTLGSAGAALLIGWLSQRFGRRLGLGAGFLIGGIGAIGVIFSAITSNIILLFTSLLVYGAGSASNLQARYAGTDLASKQQRGTAISMAMVSTTFGAVAGPNLVEVMGKFATGMGIPALSGPFILAATAYILAGLVLVIFLRPDPLVVAQAIERAPKVEDTNITNEPTTDNKKGIIAGATVMVVTQIVMVAIMTMTPVHMGHHGFGLKEVGIVIGFHIGSMYLPSLLTGILVDKIGRVSMAIAAGLTLLLSGILSALSTGDSMLLIIIALSLLGLGWNFGLISGTSLIVDATTPSTRAKTQGSVDVLIALSGASGGALSGMVVASSSFAFLSIVGGILSIVLIPVVIWSSLKKNSEKRTQVS